MGAPGQHPVSSRGASSGIAGSDSTWGPIIDARVMLEKDDPGGDPSLGEEAEAVWASSPETKAARLMKEMEQAGTKMVLSHGRVQASPDDPMGDSRQS